MSNIDNMYTNGDETLAIRPELQPYLGIVESVVQLFFPYVEGAVHDLELGKIAALYNNFSRRHVGDESPLHELRIPANKFPDVFEPYHKTNWDGRILKCTSTTIRDGAGKPVALICFNFDTSRIGDLHSRLGQLLQVAPKARNPVEEYGEEAKEHILNAIKTYLDENGLIAGRLASAHKKACVQYLYQHGIFNYKNAATLAARTLHMSRASLYNYLKEDS